MQHAANLNGVSSGMDEEQPVITDAKPKLLSLALKRFHISGARFSETMKGGKNAHGGRLIESADIGFGQFRPHNPLHAGSR